MSNWIIWMLTILVKIHAQAKQILQGLGWHVGTEEEEVLGWHLFVCLVCFRVINMNVRGPLGASGRPTSEGLASVADALVYPGRRRKNQWTPTRMAPPTALRIAAHTGLLGGRTCSLRPLGAKLGV